MKLLSWGRYPNFPQNPVTVSWRNSVFEKIRKLEKGFLPFGMGRSYGDSCLAASATVLKMDALDKFIRADWEKGIVTAEAGLTLKDLIEIGLPKGWFLPVTPGTKFVTLGGAIANDVHGKNHHSAGTFGCHVQSFTLLRSDGTELLCSRQENADFFRATIGGLGLTGVITSATLKLKPVLSKMIRQRIIKFGSLSEFFSLSEQFDDKNEYVVSWIDCLSGENTRGHFILGDHDSKQDLTTVSSKRIAFPFVPPVSLVNKLTLKPFNTLYYNKQRGEDVTSYVNFDNFFYPLDGVLNWNRMYGRKGFQQYQCVINHINGYDAVAEMLKVIQSSGTGSFLAVLKVFGNKESPGMLSFPKQGITLALDFPHSQNIDKLFQRLDQIVLTSQGRLYPAKDSHMSSQLFKSGYPEWEHFEQFRDNNIQSKFWQRVMN